MCSNGAHEESADWLRCPICKNKTRSTKIVCGECGGFYGSKVWHSTSKYRRVVWRCNEKYKDDQKCETPTINEDDLKRLFIEAFDLMYSNQSELAKKADYHSKSNR